MNDPHVLILGEPGAGKGTQSEHIAAEFDVEHITTGDALRANKHMETDYGTPAEYMDAGELVPDEVVNEILEEALSSAEGFVLDGYPRNIDQAEYLEDATHLDVVLFLDVDQEELVRRLTGRRVCSECGATYHVDFDPPEEPGVCDTCGGELYQREDDTEETVKERLRVYRENTEPVIEFYEERGELARIDGHGSPDEVWERVRRAIEDAT